MADKLLIAVGLVGGGFFVRELLAHLRDWRTYRRWDKRMLEERERDGRG